MRCDCPDEVLAKLSRSSPSAQASQALAEPLFARMALADGVEAAGKLGERPVLGGDRLKIEQERGGTIVTLRVAAGEVGFDLPPDGAAPPAQLITVLAPGAFRLLLSAPFFFS